MKHYVHHTPGRLRIKIQSIRHNPEERKAIHRVLPDIEGVERVSVNPVTGSVLIHFDEDTVFHWQILHFLGEKGYFDASGEIAGNRTSKQKTIAEELIGKAIFNWTVGKALENAGLSFLSVLI